MDPETAENPDGEVTNEPGASGFAQPAPPAESPPPDEGRAKAPEGEARGSAGRNLRETLDEGAKKESGRDRLPLGKIDPQDLRRLQELFVPSSDFRSKQAKRSHQPDYNVWIVYGPEHAGKLTTAMNLALDLLACGPADEKVYCYRRTPTDSLPLIDFVRNTEVESGKAYFLEDAFDRNVSLQDLTSPWLDAIDRTLKDKKSLLILTTERDLPDLEPLSVGKIAAFPEDLHAVFDSHLQRFARHVEGVDPHDVVVEAARGCWEQVAPFLEKPVQIERFCFKLGNLRPEIRNKDLVLLAREAAYIGQESVRQAFCELKDNHKLYALLAVLFDGIERADLDELYAMAVRHLREGGVSTLCDEREIGLDDILEKIRARESETRQVTIEDGALRKVMLQQVRNYRRLLHSLAEPLLGLCELYSAPEHWELRRTIGAALGRLGALEKRGIEPISAILNRLADHPNGGIASMVGFVLDQICRDVPQLRGVVLEHLRTWVKSGDPDRMWAVGAATWRIYEGIGPAGGTEEEKRAGDWHGRTLEVIAELIRSSDRFSRDALDGASLDQIEVWVRENLRCAFFALVRIVSISPVSAAEKLAEWLRSKPGDPVRDIAHFACGEVLKWAAAMDRGPVPEPRGWLRLIDPILALDPDLAEAGDALLAALANWSRWSGEKVESDEIFLGLLCASNRLSGKAAKSLRAGLVRHWLTSDSKAVRSRGRALLRRSHAMEGLPLRDLAPARGVVALDASADALAGGGERLALHLLEVVGCFMEAIPAHLGGKEIPLPTEGVLADRFLRPEFPRPRLLLPPIEGGPGGLKETRLALVLSWGPLLDLSDGEGQPWWPPLLVTVGNWTEHQDSAGEKRPSDAPRRPRSVPLTDDLDSVVVALAHSLNAASPPPDTGEDTAMRPEEDLTALEQAEGASSLPDRAARIVAAGLHRYATAPAACLARVRGWLEDADTEGLPRRVGTAVLRALLRFHETPGMWPSEAAKEELLRLAFLLPPNDPGAAHTVLETVLAWMDDSAWAERMVGGSSLAFDWMRWFEALIPRHPNSLERWLDEAEHQAKTDGTEETGAVRRMLRWLRFRLSLGAGGTLPVLEDGKGYGVFLLDAFSPDRLQGQILARLTIGLLEDARLRDVPRLVFRLGQRTPLAVPGEKLAREAVMPTRGSRLPRLLGPILDALPAERVRFALVLSAGPALDASDWSEGLWASRIRLYGPTDGLGPEPFVRISPPPHGDYEANPELKPEINAILSHLTSLIEKAE